MNQPGIARELSEVNSGSLGMMSNRPWNLVINLADRWQLGVGKGEEVPLSDVAKGLAANLAVTKQE